LAGAAQAQQLGGFYNYNGGDGNPPNSGSGSSNGGSSGSSGSTPASGPGTEGGFGSSFGGFVGGFDPDRAARLRAIHGILGAATMVVLFPSGAIFVRIFPAPASVWVHGLLQTLALCVLIAAVALGIRLVQDVRAGTGMDLVRVPFLPSSLICPHLSLKELSDDADLFGASWETRKSTATSLSALSSWSA